ncbi:hypothetical protein BJX65DRAFT_312848 [Aspergillus insuetus]
MFPSLAIFSALAGLCISTVSAADAITASSDGCVDKSGMDKCLTAAESQLGDCGKDAEGDTQLQACMLTYDISLLGCYIESCWNKVYSCEYQLVAVDFLSRQYPPPEDPLPFWPPPDNAPGGCVCNFGKIYDGLLSSLDLLQSTCNQYMTSVSSLQTCQCCAWSAALSAFYGTCPGYDLTNYGLSAIASTAATTEQMTGTCPDLTSSVCEGKFGIASFDDGVYPDPADLPNPGSKAPTTTEGPGPLTSPPGGETMTVTVLDTVYTLTAAGYNADDVEESDSSSPTTDSSDESSTETSTSSTSGSGSNSDSNSDSGEDSSDDSSSDSADSNSAHRDMTITVGMGLVIISLALTVTGL